MQDSLPRWCTSKCSCSPRKAWCQGRIYNSLWQRSVGQGHAETAWRWASSTRRYCLQICWKQMRSLPQASSMYDFFEYYCYLKYAIIRKYICSIVKTCFKRTSAKTSPHREERYLKPDLETWSICCPFQEWGFPVPVHGCSIEVWLMWSPHHAEALLLIHRLLVLHCCSTHHITLHFIRRLHQNVKSKGWDQKVENRVQALKPKT